MTALLLPAYKILESRGLDFLTFYLPVWLLCINVVYKVDLAGPHTGFVANDLPYLPLIVKSAPSVLAVLYKELHGV